ncbi:MAG: SusD/RagB family nutrient-binding outer membrane lipoprotein [Saprospiraceae bacterium]|nr:SusD/RagB family nutrient-binding outer membrane lipoprotein [Saprospiraceae bacterium]MBP7699436.1 SusD/RagB family nutrient-binding outer membrane lipoprotein [Saprospiraceae bacterium]
MKNIFKLYLLTAILFFGSSCSNWIDSELNVDPNNPAEVSINTLLPSSMSSFAYVLGGDYGRYTNIWTQHLAGVDRQHLAYDEYQITESDVDNAWNSMYATTLQDLKVVLDKASASNSPHYAGVAKIMTAMALGTLVDLHNDIPYSAAFQGASEIHPAYDKADQLYLKMQTMLAEAVDNLGETASTFKPGSDDIIFGGNKAKWIATANTLRARYALRLSKIDNNAAATALGYIDEGGIGSAADDCVVRFGATATNANPWFQFEDQRGDVVMGKFFVDLLVNTNDPRAGLFAADPSAGGSPAGIPNADASRFGAFYASSDSYVPLVTFAESKFIEAEAAFRTNNATRAATAFNDGVKGALAAVGASDAAYEAANANETAATISLEKILTQKYIALYTQPESFADWRRTGIPNIPLADGQTKFPRRFPYPQSERLYNSPNYISGVTAFDRVFWDVE